MAFWIAISDASGAKITASEYLLPFVPTRADYPVEALGTILETSDGQAIKQQPNKDSRRRAWVWSGYRDTVVGYTDFWHRIEGLLSRTRLSDGVTTPYIYVKEDVTRKLRIRDAISGTATGGTSNTLVTALTWTTNQYSGYLVEIYEGVGAGQTRAVISNDTNTLTVSPTWSTTPDNTSKFAVRGYTYPWLKARVLEVSRSLRDDGGPIGYPESKLVFVIDDAAYNDLG